MVKGRACPVDGTITPCWSYGDHPKLWSRKHGTTGFNAQLLSLLDGTAIYISDPLPGKTHFEFGDLLARVPSRNVGHPYGAKLIYFHHRLDHLIVGRIGDPQLLPSRSDMNRLAPRPSTYDYASKFRLT